MIQSCQQNFRHAQVLVLRVSPLYVGVLATYVYSLEEDYESNWSSTDFRSEPY